MNDDNINNYCQNKLYPHYKFLPTGWNKYNRGNSRTLCGSVLKCVRIADGDNKEWYWFYKVAPIMNKKCIDMRCWKQYKSETV